jgi:hypothetical protein
MTRGTRRVRRRPGPPRAQRGVDAAPDLAKPRREVSPRERYAVELARRLAYWKVPRACHFCQGPIPNDEKAIRARTENAWAHFECWYDGPPPFKRDVEGRRFNEDD